MVTAPWRYHPGVVEGGADPALDDSSWPWLDSALASVPEDWPGQGWFRLRLEVEPDLGGVPLALNAIHRGASEVYLDGELLTHFGQISTEGRLVEGYAAASARALAAPRNVVLPAGEHLLAVRFRDLPPELAFARTGLRGFRLAFRPADAAAEQTRRMAVSRSRFRTLVTAVPVVLGAVHFLLFLFNRRRRGDLYFALLAWASAAFNATVLRNHPAFTTDLDDLVGFILVNPTLGVLVLLTQVRFLYAVFYDRLPQSFWVFLSAGAVVAAWSFFEPISANRLGLLNLFSFPAVVEIVRVVTLALFRRRPGAWILGSGFLLAGAMTTFVVLLFMGILPWSVPGLVDLYFLVGQLGLMLAMSIYLAETSARTARELVALEAENARKSQELEEARALQLSMLPASMPEVPGVVLAAHMKPATEVGGDYYDAHLGGDGVLTVAVGDATGHGMKAGTMVSVAKSLFTVLAAESGPGGEPRSLAGLLTRMSRGIKQMHLGMLYMALTLVRVRPSDGEVVLASAGMPPAYVLRAADGSLEEIQHKAMPLGGPAFPYRETRLHLEPGDVLVLMTDGLPETFNPAGEMLGYDGARREVAQAGGREPAEVVAHLVRTCEEWATGRPADDDVTFLVLRRE